MASYKTKWMARAYNDMLKSMPEQGSDQTDELFQLEKQVWQGTVDLKMRTMWRVEVEDARARAYLKAIQDAEAALIRKKIQCDDYEGMPELAEIERQMKAIKNKRGEGGNIHLYYLVTVNCKPGVRVEELRKKVEKYAKRKMVREAEWVYEQRGAHELEAGSGMHCHILVTQRGDHFDGSFKAQTRNTFKTLVGIPTCHIDVRSVKPEHLADKRDYMAGNKTGEGKADRVKIDKIWRAANNLLDLYKHANSQASPQDTSDSASSVASSDPDEEA